MRDCFKTLLVLTTAMPARVVRAFANAPTPSWRAPSLAPTTSLSTSLLFLHEAADPSSPAPASCYVSNDDSSLRELQFDMIALLREEEDAERQARKAAALAAVLRACSLAEGNAEVEAAAEAAALPEHLAPLRRFLCTSPRAKDHRGCFRIFTEKSPAPSTSPSAAASPPVSMPSNVLFSQERPFVYLRDALSYRSEASIRKRGGVMYDSSEAVVWCSSTASGPGELEFASKVLDDMPFAQLRLGSGLGNRNSQGEDVDHKNHLIVELDLTTVQVLESMGVLLGNDGDMTNGDRLGTHTVCRRVTSDDLAVIETMLDCHNQEHAPESLRDQHQQPSTLFKMIDAAVDAVRKDPLNEGNAPHLVLLAHSVSASAVAAAITAWKRHQTQQQGRSTRRVEDLLHQAVTVVTFGNVCRSFCDGPAYVHVSMYDDPWTAALGSHSHDDRRGGKDAVYFHASSPYEYDQVRWDAAPSPATPAVLSSLKSHNAHNLHACTLQYLCLIMRINGIDSFRALYDAANFVDPTFVLDISPTHFAVSPCNHGDLILPPHIDHELLPAMIRATRGDAWIWKADGDPDGDVESLLPDEIETRSHLGHLYDAL